MPSPLQKGGLFFTPPPEKFKRGSAPRWRYMRCWSYSPKSQFKSHFKILGYSLIEFITSSPVTLHHDWQLDFFDVKEKSMHRSEVVYDDMCGRCWGEFSVPKSSRMENTEKAYREGLISSRIIHENIILWLWSLDSRKCGLDICSDRN